MFNKIEDATSGVPLKAIYQKPRFVSIESTIQKDQTLPQKSFAFRLVSKSWFLSKFGRVAINAALKRNM